MASDYVLAATRHYKDAEHLAALERFDNAGHLMGFAAECALKKAALGFFKGRSEIDGHLPGQLKATIRRELDGRGMRSGQLYSLVKPQSEFFREWSVNDRYSVDNHVDKAKYDAWRQQARSALSVAKIRLPK